MRLVHGAEQVGNQLGKSVAFQFGSKGFEDVVTCCLLDFIGDVGNGFILLGRLRDGLAGESVKKFVGELANLEEAERAANFIKCALRKLRAWNRLQPFDRSALRITGFGRRVVNKRANYFPDVDITILLDG